MLHKKRVFFIKKRKLAFYIKISKSLILNMYSYYKGIKTYNQQLMKRLYF
ncbi:MAG: hypothetical protein H6Q13_1874 [Bacteroidetes bacterium]|jgi:hypothetical protein|nr:hypothetical protein [Bacteroidota bacterium]